MKSAVDRWLPTVVLVITAVLITANVLTARFEARYPQWVTEDSLMIFHCESTFNNTKPAVNVAAPRRSRHAVHQNLTCPRVTITLILSPSSRVERKVYIRPGRCGDCGVRGLRAPAGDGRDGHDGECRSRPTARST